MFHECNCTQVNNVLGDLYARVKAILYLETPEKASFSTTLKQEL